MPNYETVLRRSYLVIAFSIFVLLIAVSIIPSFSRMDNESLVNVTLYKALSNMLYYPSEDPSPVFLDERFVDVPAREPIVKTEREEIEDYINLICESYPNVSPDLIKSMIISESSFNPKAKNGTHVGLMQVSTVWHADRARRLGVTDFYDPYGNVLLGIDYVSELIMQTEGDETWALMIYNMGHKAAYENYSKGIVSSYAREILSRV